MCCQANYNALRRQLAVLKRFQDDPARWDRLIERLISDYTSPVDDRDGCRAEVALLSNGDGRTRLPVVAGELVISSSNWPLPAQTQAILIEYEFDLPEEERVRIERHPEATARRFVTPQVDVDLAAVIDAINAVGEAQATPNVLRVMNVVTKSKSGAEPACCCDLPEPPENAEAGEGGIVVVLDTGRFRDGHAQGLLHDVGGDEDPRFAHDGYLNLSAGHGTFIAGVIRQICPAVSVEVTRVIGPAGFAPDSKLADAIRGAGERIAKGPGHGVINLSLGSDDYGDEPPPLIREALADVAALPGRIMVVCAAGNEHSGNRIYPAAFADEFDHVVAVSSLDRNGEPSTWSNFGSWVDFSVIGEGIISTYLEGEEKRGTGADDDPYDPEPDEWIGPTPWAVWTGTSFAAPQVAALLANCLASGLDVEASKAELESNGQEHADFGFLLIDTGQLVGNTVAYVEEPTRPDDPPPTP